MTDLITTITQEFAKHQTWYHGTNEQAVDSILQHGLVPGKVQYDKNAFEGLHKLVLKAGFSRGLGSTYLNRSDEDSYEVYLTSYLSKAFRYAQHSPEVLFNFLNKPLIRSQAQLIHMITSGKFAGRSETELTEYVHSALASATIPVDDIAANSLLSKPEVEQAFKYLQTLHDEFETPVPVVIAVSTQAPAILEEHPFLESIDTYIAHRLKENERDKQIAVEMNWDHTYTPWDGVWDLGVTSAIPTKFIIDVLRENPNN